MGHCNEAYENPSQCADRKPTLDWFYLRLYREASALKSILQANETCVSLALRPPAVVEADRKTKRIEKRSGSKAASMRSKAASMRRALYLFADTAPAPNPLNVV